MGFDRDHVRASLSERIAGRILGTTVVVGMEVIVSHHITTVSAIRCVWGAMAQPQQIVSHVSNTHTNRTVSADVTSYTRGRTARPILGRATQPVIRLVGVQVRLHMTA
jgi:hypothetical protein